jgi:hypothetical protein
MKRVGYVLAFLLALGAVGYVVFTRWVTVSLRQLERTFEADVAAEREIQSAWRSPVSLRGDPLAENAVDAYERARRWQDLSSMSPNLRAVHSGAPLDVMAASQALGELSRAARLTSREWDLRFEQGVEQFFGGLGAWEALGHSAVATGNNDARTESSAGAAVSYRDAARLGLHVSSGPTLNHAILGRGIAGCALDALARLLASGELSGEDAGRALAEALALESRIPSLAEAARRHRLAYLGSLRLVARGEKTIEDATGIVVDAYIPERPFVALTWRSYDGLMREIEQALAAPDRSEQFARLKPLFDRGMTAGRMNPFLWAGGTWQATDAAEADHELRARFPLLRAVHGVVRFREQHGRFPAALADALPAPPLDPFDGKPIRYQRAVDGKTAKVWSIGSNAMDDLGTPYPDVTLDKGHDEPIGAEPGDFVVVVGPIE